MAHSNTFDFLTLQNHLYFVQSPPLWPRILPWLPFYFFSLSLIIKFRAPSQSPFENNFRYFILPITLSLDPPRLFVPFAWFSKRIHSHCSQFWHAFLVLLHYRLLWVLFTFFFSFNYCFLFVKLGLQLGIIILHLLWLRLTMSFFETEKQGHWKGSELVENSFNFWFLRGRVYQWLWLLFCFCFFFISVIVCVWIFCSRIQIFRHGTEILWISGYLIAWAMKCSW